MARFHDVTFDCAHPASLARFWASAVDGYEVAPYDDEELERLRSRGIDGPEDDPSVLVQPVSGRGPRLFFTLVPEPKTVKNRVHLDLRTDDLDAETRRLVGLGARVLARHDDAAGGANVVFADPEGNEFCVAR